MLFKPVNPMQPAGGSGGLVLYKNGTQLAARSWAMPVVGKSNAQVYTRYLISELSIYWENPLTNAQRAAWGDYAFNTPLKDAYGNDRYIKGYAHFMRSNRPRLQHGLPWLADPPAAYGFGTFTPPTYNWVPSLSQLWVNFTSSDDWANQNGGALLLWLGRPQSATRLTPTEVYAPLLRIDGSSAGISSPYIASVSLPTIPPNTTYVIRSGATTGDGAYSATTYPTPDTQKVPVGPPIPPPPPSCTTDSSLIATVTGPQWTIDRSGLPTGSPPFWPDTAPWISPCSWQQEYTGAFHWTLNAFPSSPLDSVIEAGSETVVRTSFWKATTSTWWYTIYQAQDGNTQPQQIFVQVS